MNWLAFTLMTVVSWGLYGILLHHGQTMMADKDNALYKSFLFVGLAYFLTAVLAPLAMLVVRKANWNYPTSGMTWSLIAGVAGAVGAFCVLLAFGTRSQPPPVIMSIVFGGAPLVTAVANYILHPPPGGFGSINLRFYLGVLLAAAGGVLLTKYRPGGVPPKPASAPTAQTAPAGTNSH